MRINDYGLGDVVANFAKAVGIQRPCKGCKDRQKKLNEWGRRSFIGRMVAFPLVVKAALVNKVTTAVNDEVGDALNLVRILNCAHAKIKTAVKKDDGTYVYVPGTEADVVAYLKNSIVNPDPMHPHLPEDERFLRSLNLDGREMLAGWEHDMHIKPMDIAKPFGGVGYVLVLKAKNSQDVLISDSHGVIYRMQTAIPPAASSLETAAHARAVSWDRFAGTIPAASKAKSYLKAVSLRLMERNPRLICGIYWCLNCVSPRCNNQCCSVAYCYCETRIADCGCGGSFCTTNPIGCYGGCSKCYDLSCNQLIGNNCFAAFANPGVGDCGWCGWTNADGTDCSNAQACTHLPGPRVYCCCPSTDSCGCSGGY